MSERAPSPFVTHAGTNEGWEDDEEAGGLVLMLRTEPVQVGLWKPNGGAGQVVEYELEADETVVIVEGTGELRVDDGAHRATAWSCADVVPRRSRALAR
jgi:uncharacterized cupin superfamily protein